MSLPRLNRPRQLASWQIESATPVEIDTDLYWTTVEMQRVENQITACTVIERNDYETAARRNQATQEKRDFNELWEALDEHREDLDAEYRKRMWLRAYLVTSSDGHIHSGPYCTTFQANTTCTLLPQASGMTREEIIDAVGEKGCTVCFSGAPVKPTTLRDPLTAQEQDAKAAEKAQKAATLAAKAITTPDGAPLYTATTKASGGFRDQDLIKTEIAAQRRATSTLKDLGWYGLGFDDEAQIETFKRLIHALAAKQNHAVGVLIEEYYDRASKAVKRDSGEMLISWKTVSSWF